MPEGLTNGKSMLHYRSMEMWAEPKKNKNETKKKLTWFKSWFGFIQRLQTINSIRPEKLLEWINCTHYKCILFGAGGCVGDSGRSTDSGSFPFLHVLLVDLVVRESAILAGRTATALWHWQMLDKKKY